MKFAPRMAGTRRGGFTLVELLVAAALCVVIMTILAVSFRSGMDTLSQMKTVGDLTDKLRAAEVVMQNDLAAYHLEDEAGLPVRVSDRSVNKKWDGTNRGWTGAQQKKGFFRVVQGSAPKDAPGVSPAVFGAGAATDPYLHEGGTEAGRIFRAHDHSLHFTSRLSGQSDKDAFTIAVPNVVAIDVNLKNGLAPAGNNLSSTWAEVAYFMQPTGQFTAGTNSFPLYTLYRRQRVIAQTAPSTVINLSTDVLDLSLNGTSPNLQLNTPLTITNIVNRLFGTTAPTKLTGADEGKDVLLSNVVSFQVQVMKNDDVEFTDVPGGTWDSATQGTGAATRIRGVQIKLRVYDVKNAVTRQMTLQQDL